MIRKYIYILICTAFFASCATSKKEVSRSVFTLKNDWKFTKGATENAEKITFDDAKWQTVNVPHDWAIYGPFDSLNDVQNVKVVADMEKKAKTRFGRTGGLPYMGIGWYRKTFDAPTDINNKKAFIEFDGAMSHAQVFVNGKFVGEWLYGYSSFQFDISDFVVKGKNVLAVRLENQPESSRWYPGAGLYRNVRLVYTSKNYVKHWGTYITTPKVSSKSAEVVIKTTLEGTDKVTLRTEIYNAKNELVVKKEVEKGQNTEGVVSQIFTIESPELWSIDKPVTYKILSKVIKNKRVIDVYESTFGIRYFEFTANDGFHLNGKRVPIQGVCMHHDLGALGSAVNVSALKRQLDILKSMGCNAIRTAHNSPTPELLTLCDSMGFIVMDEAFDEWKTGKNRNGYALLWDDWAEKDLMALIHRDQNHPSVFMWSVGNEILEQFTDDGWKRAKFLVDIAHREDSTRPVTIGMNREDPSKNNFGAQFDLKGWNYHTHLYPWLKEQHPDWKFIASETQSTVASRGYFDLDAQPRKNYVRKSLQASDYALDYCNWSNTPDVGFAMLDENPHVAGEFVWTGFDYLGEPSPYNSEWPNKNSLFGIVDMCGFPKSMYYMYKARWTKENVLHILPHWNWDAKKVKTVPVHVFTNFNSAELFVNGKSQGIRTKNPKEVYERYRLVWKDVPYQAGEVKVVALGEKGERLMENSIKTAAEPYTIKQSSNYTKIKADGESLSFIEVDIVDKDGNFCPTADVNITFSVEGEGRFEVGDNGNMKDITPFQSNERKTFNGKCLVMIRPTYKAGKIIVKAEAAGLKTSEMVILTY